MEAEKVNQSPEPQADNPGDGTIADAIAAELAALEAETSENAPDEGNAEPETAEADESSDNATETESQEETPASSVEIDYEGKTYKIAPELKDAFLRQSDYTRKAMEVAEIKRAVQQRETHVEGALKVLPAVAEGLAAQRSIEHNIAQTVKYLQDNPTLSSTDPLQYATVTGNLSLLQVQRGQVQNSLGQAAQQLQQFEQGKRQQDIAAGAKYLSENGLDTKALRTTAQYIAERGVSPVMLQQLDAGVDPALLLLLDKARRYDELQAQKPNVSKKVAQATPVVRPGAVTPKTTGIEVYGKKLKSSGSVNDAVALELARMERAARR